MSGNGKDAGTRGPAFCIRSRRADLLRANAVEVDGDRRPPAWPCVRPAPHRAGRRRVRHRASAAPACRWRGRGSSAAGRRAASSRCSRGSRCRGRVRAAARPGRDSPAPRRHGRPAGGRRSRTRASRSRSSAGVRRCAAPRRAAQLRPASPPAARAASRAAARGSTSGRWPVCAISHCAMSLMLALTPAAGATLVVGRLRASATPSRRGRARAACAQRGLASMPSRP